MLGALHRHGGVVPWHLEAATLGAGEGEVGARAAQRRDPSDASAPRILLFRCCCGVIAMVISSVKGHGAAIIGGLGDVTVPEFSERAA